MSDVVLTINAFNANTGTTFNLEKQELKMGTSPSFMWRTTQKLDSTLPNSASQTYSAHQDHLGWVAECHASLEAVWNDGTSRFGVRAHSPGKIAGVGTSPYYEYMTDKNVGSGLDDVKWIKPESPASSATVELDEGYTVDFSPVADTSSIVVTMNITVTQEVTS